MQTFLPYKKFSESAFVLDKKRLLKQVVEAKQILCILRYWNIPTDWKQSKCFQNQSFRNHPGVKMWEGYEEKLKVYFNVFLFIALDRRIKFKLLSLDTDKRLIKEPWWLGDENFHRAHRARLIEKNREFYLPLFPDDEGFNDCKYLWPDNETKTFKII